MNADVKGGVSAWSSVRKNISFVGAVGSERSANVQPVWSTEHFDWWISEGYFV
jgi:hypothetical protein